MEDSQAGGVPAQTGGAGSGATGTTGTGTAAKTSTPQTTAPAQQSASVAAPSTQAGIANTPQNEPEKPKATTEDKSKSLTEDPRFKNWQSQSDQRLAQLQAQAQQATQQAAAAQRELESLRLAGMDDSEKARHLEQKLTQIEQGQAQRAYQAQVQDWYTQQAFQMIQRAGVDPGDERLGPYLTGGPTPQGMTQLAFGLIDLARKDAEEARKEAKLAADRAKVDALNEAGVTQTSNGTGTGAALSADEAKKDAVRQKLQGRAGKQMTPAEYAELRREAKSVGATWAK